MSTHLFTHVSVPAYNINLVYKKNSKLSIDPCPMTVTLTENTLKACVHVL